MTWKASETSRWKALSKGTSPAVRSRSEESRQSRAMFPKLQLRRGAREGRWNHRHGPPAEYFPPVASRTCPRLGSIPTSPFVRRSWWGSRECKRCDRGSVLFGPTLAVAIDEICVRLAGLQLSTLEPELGNQASRIVPSLPAQAVIDCVQHVIRSKFCYDCHVGYRPNACTSRLPVMPTSGGSATHPITTTFPPDCRHYEWHSS